ncbi:hypothetical protein LPC08_13140 [Roseomonas sp. OT10]|uniref:hypothetical protein n=1 Tax=Roseomonas cutis TaxID=2897332 RepID=UPI001E52B4AC|nr:hypothetical protein [Roseomonas sp. OT10]UFN46974.1 hypothetical protein LPC08_13140 [Roseomonas sp. OT10]
MSGTRKKDEARIDETVEESFPASDPPANTGITGPVAEPVEGTDPEAPDQDGDLPEDHKALLEEIPPEEMAETPHEWVRDWRGEFPLRGG